MPNVLGDLLNIDLIKSITGPQSMFVLMVLLLVWICVVFFYKETAKIKVPIFLILLACAVPFAVKMFAGESKQKTSNEAPLPPASKPQTLPSIPSSTGKIRLSERSKASANATEEKHSRGLIRVEADGTTFVVTSEKGEENHVPLGKDRVQKVYTAPDGRAGVVVFKIRESSQYMAIPVDMVTGKDGDPQEIDSMPVSIDFRKSEAVLSYSQGGIQKIMIR